jgi:hypothetical protein
MLNRQNAFNPSTQLVPTIQLCINDFPAGEQNQTFIDKFKFIFVSVQFTRLNIDCTKISIGTLVKIIQLLPNLDSLKLSSLPHIEPGWLFDNDADVRFLTSINNKITKVNLEKVINIEQVHFLLYLCLCIQYFQMDVSENMDLEMLGRFILRNTSTYVPQLRSLCLCVPNASEEIVHKLHKLIDTEKLLSNYTIKRICNKIFLKWT